VHVWSIVDAMLDVQEEAPVLSLLLAKNAAGVRCHGAGGPMAYLELFLPSIYCSFTSNK
jgi:hypothetical protein